MHGAAAPRRADSSSFEDVLAEKVPDAITWRQAQVLDAHERERGLASGRPRVKVVRTADMLAIARGSAASTSRAPAV